jgi:hypothetical protein
MLAVCGSEGRLGVQEPGLGEDGAQENGRSSPRSMLAWQQVAKNPFSAAASGNGSTPPGVFRAAGTSVHRSRTNRAGSPGYEYPAAAWPDPAGVGFPSSIFAPAGRRGGASSPVDQWRGAVLLVADVLAPGRGVPVLDLHHRYVGHEAVRGGAVPVVLAGLEEHAVAWADHLDRPVAALAEADALGDEAVCPLGWVCWALRAPGVQWTLLACRREGPGGAATAAT